MLHEHPILLQVRMSIEYGILPLSAEAFAWYAWNVCAPLKNNPREAYEWGHLGMLLAQKHYHLIKHSDRTRIRHHYYGMFNIISS